MIPQYERYYNEDTSWGCYTFATTDDIPQYEECHDSLMENSQEDQEKKMGILAGKMQQLYIGSEYEVTAECKYDSKYRSYNYVPSIVTAVMPKTCEEQKKFLQTVLTKRQVDILLDQYPNIVEDVVNHREAVDIKKLNGIGAAAWETMKEKIISNYVISDILIMLQPLGVTFNMIKKLISSEPNPALLKEQLLDNPYIMTRIRGLGFKTVDKLAMKLRPELRVSDKRTYAFLRYFFEETGEKQGHTWVDCGVLDSAVRDNINECAENYCAIYEREQTAPRMLWIENGCVGLREYHNIEMDVLEILKSLDQFQSSWKLDVEAGIKKAESEQGFSLSKEQRTIVEDAVNHHVVLISGKAGCGKTTIARALLHIYKLAKKSISCCALSAKAAQRITEATGYSASTIHRLLGTSGKGFLHNREYPLECDVLLIDECSMMNSSIFLSVLLAVREGTRVVFCGDNRQLPPIGYGNIFSDLLEMRDVFHAYQLTTVHRQAKQSGILNDANQIRDGICPIAAPELKIITGELRDMTYMFRDSREGLQGIAVRTYLKCAKEESLDDLVVITPRKQDCPNSTLELNNLILNALIPDGPELKLGKKIYRPGAKVIQRVNNYDKGVFNGETGYLTRIWEEEHGKTKSVFFEVKFGNTKTIRYSRGELEQIDLAYALTVHLAQGSGYNTVIVVIDNTHYNLLDTCLLYTALTRAKKRCLLLAEPSAFHRCIVNNKSISRQTWLEKEGE